LHDALPIYGGGGAPGGAGRAGSGSGGGQGGSGGGLHSAASSNGTVPAEYRDPGGDKRLRTDVQALSTCLGVLPSLEHQVLALRAGIGTAPMSRSATAARLNISRQQEMSAEGRGIEDLESAAQAGGCAAESGPATLAARGDLIAANLGAVPQLQPALLLGRPLETPVALANPQVSALSGVDAASASGGSSPLATAPVQLAATEPTIQHPQLLIAFLLAALLITAATALRGRREARRAEQLAVLEGGLDAGVGLNPMDASAAVLEPVAVYAPSAGHEDGAAPAGAREPEVVDGSAVPMDEADEGVDPVHHGAAAMHPARTSARGSRAGTTGTAAAARSGSRRAAVVAAGLASLALTSLVGRRRRG
ncbi:MAG: hypothetical protein JOZ25_03020, partial [Actinobacteria bacterium]|nr:hypothetical protein [Actinomycetota bacterium]